MLNRNYPLRSLFSIAIMDLVIGNGNATDVEMGEAKTQPVSTKTLHSPQFLDDLKLKKLKNPCQKLVLGGTGVIGTGVTFTLEVLGATGAFWGATDVCNFRDDSNDYYFRIGAMTIGGVALIRYISVHAFNNNKYKDYLTKTNQGDIFQKMVWAFESPVSAIRDLGSTLLSPVVHKIWTRDSSSNAAQSDQDETELGEYGESAILLRCTGEDLNGCNNACVDPKPIEGAYAKHFECELKYLAGQTVDEENEQL